MIPYLDVGNDGPPVLFSHANGYPPECYKSLFEKIAQNYHVLAMYQRPLWEGSDFRGIQDWLPFTQDLLSFIEELKITSIVAIGHSLGGIVSLRASLQKPNLFRALILIDPVLLPTEIIRLWQLVHGTGLHEKLHPFSRKTKNRKRTFESREQLFIHYRQKSIFRFISDENLQALVTGLTHPVGQHYELVYSPEWESHIYATALWRDMDIWHAIPQLRVPLLVVRGSETNTFWENTGRILQKRLPTARIITFDQSTHLVPFECPNEVSQVIISYLEECL